MIRGWSPRVRQALSRVGTVIFIALLVLITALKVRYGGGTSFPEPSLAAVPLPAAAVQQIAELPSAITALAVTAGDRLFIGLANPDLVGATLMEWSDGAAQPFPPLSQRVAHDDLRTVSALALDGQGRLWALDHGQHGLSPARLVAFSLANGARVHDFEMPRAIAPMGSYLSALAVTTDGRTVVMADASFVNQQPALVVYDTQLRTAHRALEGHVALLAERHTPRVNGRRMEIFGLISLRPHVNALALSPDGQSLAWAAPANTRLYHLPLQALVDRRRSDQARTTQLRQVPGKPFSEGLLWLSAQQWLTGAPQAGSLVSLTANGVPQQLGTDLPWPGALTTGPDGAVYWADIGLDRTAGRMAWQRRLGGPFGVYRLAAQNLP